MFRKSLRMPLRVAAVLTLCLPFLVACGGDDESTIRVYSGRHYDLEVAFTQFAKETGINVEFLYGGDAELLERIKAEGEDTPADIFMTVDAGNLWNAAQQDLLLPIQSSVLDEAVPEGLRDPQDRWVGLSMRVRTLMYNPDKVQPSDFDATDSYAGLGDPKWKGRLCMRTATSPYVQSLVAQLIDKQGRDRALEIVKSWVANDVNIIGDDVTILKTVNAGGCDVAITNHYYLARLLEDDSNFKVKPYWANQDGEGVHVNISGAGILKNSDNVADAQKLLEWLATTGANSFVDGNHEYPVNPDVKPDDLISGFGTFKFQPINAEAYGKLNADAIALMSEAGYR
ncbi:extracellular solute-binding protein [Sporichthya polymorpha]|uniref:extracellular solute-binding protein n=1 Tax=Sporichthya polymorpha TaxID=35751 RepID=UPI001B7FE491|nr:extracellular solute-binding protein [Sporichthya polymorpha]